MGGEYMGLRNRAEVGLWVSL